MWPKFVNSKLFASLLTVTITVITTIAVQGFVSKEKYKELLRNELKEKTSYDYVDKQDNNIKDNLRQHIEESNETDKNMMELVKSMDRKIDLLITKMR